VLADIDDQHALLKTHVGSLEVARAALDQVIDRITATYGDPNDGSSEQGRLVRGRQVLTGSPPRGRRRPGRFLGNRWVGGLSGGTGSRARKA
jgi:hypothetical protein